MDKVFVIGRDSFPELVRLSSGEEFRAVFVVLPGTSGKYALEIDIDGQDCVVDIAGLYICSGKDSVELDVTLRHNSPGSTSTQQFLGVVGGEAKAVFDGLVYVAHGAMRTKAYQENRSILLDSSAFVESRPQLEIYADDVECSHGCTSGYLAPDELFYLRSRGIPEDEARRLQKIAFLSPVLKRVPAELAEEIYDSIS